MITGKRANRGGGYGLKLPCEHVLHGDLFSFNWCAPVAQLVEHWAVTREIVSSTWAGPTLRVLK